MFNPYVFENSAPEGVGVLEILAGLESGTLKRFVPLKRTHLGGLVGGPLATMTITHVYGYTSEQCNKVLEAAYRFPLPGDAAVTGVLVSFGDVEIQAELKERNEAEEDYAKAKRQGRQAALVTRESPDVFSLLVAGIEPDQDITVETTFVLLAKAEGTGWSLRVPLTTAPRYVRGDETDSRRAQGQPLFTLRNPGHTFSLDILVSEAALIESPTHTLAFSGEDDRTRVRLREGSVVPDRDFVLSWLPSQEEARPALQVFTQDDDASGSCYFLATVSPPAAPPLAGALKREVILLVDHSGSMEGAKWEAANWAVKKFLLGLQEGDAFALCLFHNSTRWFTTAPTNASPDTIRQAIRFLEKHRDSGGTELGVALEQALDQERAEGDYLRHVLIITDAQVTDDARILQLAEEESFKAKRRRISIFCVDTAPNSFLAQQLAEKGGGLAKFLTSSSEDEDITSALAEILDDWAQPVIPDLELRIDRLNVHFTGLRSATRTEPGWSTADLGDLPSRRTLWIAGRVAMDNQAVLNFSLASHSEILVTHSLRTDEGKSVGPSIKPLYGARQILTLEQLMNKAFNLEELAEPLRSLGYEPREILETGHGERRKIYAENVAREMKEVLRRLLVQESLEFGIACAETAFVAIRKEQGKIIQGTVPVANALPKDWSADFISGPNYPIRSANLRLRLAPTAPSFLHDTLTLDGGMPGTSLRVLFSGIPSFQGKRAVLFDSGIATGANQLPDYLTFSRITLRALEKRPSTVTISPDLVLLIYVGDLTRPRARVRVTDLITMEGEHPLNIRKEPDQQVLFVLEDGKGTWTTGAPRIEMALGFIPLTPTEYRLLSCLASNAGRVISWESLLRRVWHWEPSEKGREILKSYIRRLRKKVEPDPAEPNHILSVRGIGFMFEDPAVPSQPGTSLKKTTTGRRKALIVENEPQMAGKIADALQREGFDVTTAYDGEEALLKVDEIEPDVIILDCTLPRLDGFEVCRRVRQQTTIPVMMLTAKKEEKDIIHALELGADDYMTKPFKHAELVLRTKAILRRTEPIC